MKKIQGTDCKNCFCCSLRYCFACRLPKAKKFNCFFRRLPRFFNAVFPCIVNPKRAIFKISRQFTYTYCKKVSESVRRQHLYALRFRLFLKPFARFTSLLFLYLTFCRALRFCLYLLLLSVLMTRQFCCSLSIRLYGLCQEALSTAFAQYLSFT